MRRGLTRVACVLLLAAPVAVPIAVPRARAAEQRFDLDMASQVYGTALSFMAPRTLDPIPPGVIAMWGLHGVAAFDPAFEVQMRGNRVALLGRGLILHMLPAPKADDSLGWGRLAAQMDSDAYTLSPTLQRAGPQAVVQGFFDEIFSHFDPYSRYAPPAPAEAARDRLAIEASAGINLVRRHAGQTVVSDVVPTGPAEAADVRVGDQLIAIDGARLLGRKLDDVRTALTGQEGQHLKLRLRGVDGVVREAMVILAPVPPETVTTQRFGPALVIKISSFTANTAERLSQALDAGLIAHPSAVVVDLRGNRGGLLRQAVTSVALLTETGMVASTAGRAPEATHDWRIEGGDLTGGLPVIVLIDGKTASAAEIMAAAIADLGRGVVVGSASLGKGLVQTLTRLPDGGELFLTWSRVLAPDGWPLQELGVIPQICTSLGDQETRHELDQLAAGERPLLHALSAARGARVPVLAAQATEIRAACPAAEGHDLDWGVVKYLLEHPDIYKAALLPAHFPP